MCTHICFQEHIDMPHYPLTHVSGCGVAEFESEIMVMAMVFQAGMATRSAIAFYVPHVDYTASANNAYAIAAPTISHMAE